MVGLKLSGLLPLPNGCYLKHLCIVWHHWIRIYNLRSMHYHLQLANTYAQSPISDIQLSEFVYLGVMGSVPFFFKRLFLLSRRFFQPTDIRPTTPSRPLRSLTLLERWTMPLRRAEEHRTRAPVYAGPCQAWLDVLGCAEKLPLKKKAGNDRDWFDGENKKTDKRIWILKNVPVKISSTNRANCPKSKSAFFAWPRDRYQRQSSNIYTHVKGQRWWLRKCPTAQQLAHTSAKKTWPVATYLVSAPRIIPWNCWIQRWVWVYRTTSKISNRIPSQF